MPDKANKDYMWLHSAANDNGSMGRIGPDGGLTDRENEWCTASRGRNLASPTGSEEHDEGNDKTTQLQEHEDEQGPEETTKNDETTQLQHSV